jgi:SAM-dependent methyltransferase
MSLEQSRPSKQKYHNTVPMMQPRIRHRFIPHLLLIKLATSTRTSSSLPSLPANARTTPTFIGHTVPIRTSATTCTRTRTRTRRIIRPSTANSSSSLLAAALKEPEEEDSNFGRMDYWNKCYEEDEHFSWYSEWNDIQPFFTELVPLELEQDGTKQKPRVLLPGIGNDGSMVDMFDYGYTQMTAYDYAPEGVECAKRFFGDRKCDVQVADARNLPFENDSFDAILEKGTLDAIYLSGAGDKTLAGRHLDMAVLEMARILREGGICMSITAACTDAVKQSFERCEGWRMVRDGGLIITEDGYTSNNVDATIFAWEKI